MKYYILKDQKHDGPYTIDELRSFNIAPTTMVWAENLPGWTAAASVPELATYLFGGAQDPATLPNGGYQNCNQPYSQYAQPMGAQQPMCPKTWLVESILVTVLCCLPFGVVGIVKASQVESLYRAGNYAGAEKASKDAGKWTKIGAAVGLAVGLIYVLFVVVAALAGNM